MCLQKFLMMRSFTESKSNRFLEHFLYFFSRKFSSTRDLTSCKLDRRIPSVKWVIIVHSEMICNPHHGEHPLQFFQDVGHRLFSTSECIFGNINLELSVRTTQSWRISISKTQVQL